MAERCPQRTHALSDHPNGPRSRVSVKGSTIRSMPSATRRSRATTRTCGSAQGWRRSETPVASCASDSSSPNGVHESGYREVIGLDVGECETEAFGARSNRGLVKRGLNGVELVVSDAHAGPKSAIAQVHRRRGLGRLRFVVEWTGPRPA